MATMQDCSTESDDIAGNARGALERVCSGAGLDPASRYYSTAFVDHVNDLVFRGLEGTQLSIEMYRSAIPDMKIAVEEQVVEGDRVASRFVVTGTCLGRPVRFNGITLSRFENGTIVEDWSVTDTLGMLRQIGLWRSLVVGLRQWRALRRATTAQAANVRPEAQNVSVLRRT
jgi:predicted ester cyclase